MESVKTETEELVPPKAEESASEAPAENSSEPNIVISKNVRLDQSNDICPLNYGYLTDLLCT